MIALLQNTVTISWEGLGVISIIVSGLMGLALYLLKVTIKAMLFDFKVELLEELDERYLKRKS